MKVLNEILVAISSLPFAVCRLLLAACCLLLAVCSLPPIFAAMFYLVKTPWVIKSCIYPRYLWSMPPAGKKLYLTFDDGPHPRATTFVLDELKKFNAKASFFCIGKNVLDHPGIFNRILTDGHSVGNHTHNHLNGWRVSNEAYVENIAEASMCIDTTLFRPPYGKITRVQAGILKKKFNYSTVMWSVLSGDFDARLSPEACFKNVISATSPGSIIVFHDSEKAMKNVAYSLPLVLKYFSEKGFTFERLAV